MTQLSTYTKKILRIPILTATLVSVLAFIIAYSGIIFTLKSKFLESQVESASETVMHSIMADDWDIALGHLKSVVRSGRIYNLSARTKNGTTVVGPIGENPLGLGQICSERDYQNNLKIQACLKLFDMSDVLIMLLFLLFVLILLRISVLAIYSNVRKFIEDISFSLVNIENRDALNFHTSRFKEIEEIGVRIQNLINSVREQNRDATIGRFASQLAHDIRSPLAALEMVVSAEDVLQEEKRLLIRAATSRIRDIANDLLVKNKTLDSSTKDRDLSQIICEEPILLSSLIESLLSEKRMQFHHAKNLLIDSNIGSSTYGIFALVSSADLKRVLSNLINNSVEAIEKKYSQQRGEVIVTLVRSGDFVQILLVDNGPGIPLEIVNQLGNQRVSIGKAGVESGFGLGVYHAKETIEKYGGSFKISSEPNKGTTITMEFKVALEPEWFVPRINLKTGQLVVVLDDDHSIHEIWEGKGKLHQFSGFEIKLIHFYSTTHLKDWFMNL